MNRCKVLIPVGCRSDEGLSKPVIKRLNKNKLFNPVHVCNLTPASFYESYKNLVLEYYGIHFDLVFITGDRIEMTAAACWAFHNHIPIAHYYGGILNDPIATPDDINRHCISLWSDIQFVESNVSLWCLESLFISILKKANIHVVGITHMENVEVDESLVPEDEYDLVLVNAICKVNENTYNLKKEFYYDIRRNHGWKNERKEIWIQSNPDFSIKSVPTSYAKKYENLPRPQFLGLLKNCKRFITNSSSAIYEAPYFLKPEQIVMVGDRNKNRPTCFYKHEKYLASELIVERLKNWWIKKNE